MLVGNDAADLVVRYAAALASNRIGDAVTLNVYNAEGTSAEATLLLDTGAPLMVESLHTDLPEPDNSEAVEYMASRMRELADSVAAPPAEQQMPPIFEDLDLL